MTLYDWFYFEKVVKSIKTVYLPRELKVQNSTAHTMTNFMFINFTIILPGSLFKQIWPSTCKQRLLCGLLNKLHGTVIDENV